MPLTTPRGHGILQRIKWILPEVNKMDDQAFYVIEQARDVSKILKPIHTPIGGWRAVFKKK